MTAYLQSGHSILPVLDPRRNTRVECGEEIVEGYRERLRQRLLFARLIGTSAIARHTGLLLR